MVVNCPQIGHRFYQKPMANTNFISWKSAIPSSTKIAILIQEGLRRLFNTSPSIVEIEKVDILREFNVKMFEAGYPESVRLNVTEKVIDKYTGRLEDETNSVRRMYRNSKERKKEKKEKNVNRSNWYKKGRVKYDGVLKVPSTPKSTLATSIRKKLENENLSVKVLIQEEVGCKIRDKISNARDPWMKEHCRRENCFMCTSGNVGDCWQTNATYVVICNVCMELENKEVEYFGESGRTLFSRGLNHLTGLRLGTKGNVLHEHNKEAHKHFKMTREHWTMKMTGRYRTNIERQASEGLQIEEGLRASKMDFREKVDKRGMKQLLNSRADFAQPGVVQSCIQRVSDNL